MKTYAMLDALKERKSDIVLRTLKEAEKEYRQFWTESVDKDISTAYAGWSPSQAYDNAYYKFADCREDDNDFDIEDWVCGMCLGVIDEYVNSGKAECMEASVDVMPCFMRNITRAAFFSAMFPDEAKELVKEMSRINGDEVADD